MKISETIQKSLDLICKKHRVNNLYLFGSMAKGTDKSESDIDLLVQFGPVDLYHYFDNYTELKSELERLFERTIDLIEDQAIRNPVFRHIVDRDKKQIYGRKVD